MVVELSLTASAAYPSGGFHHLERGLCRAAKEFQPFLSSHCLKPEILRSGCVQFKTPLLEDPRKFTHLLPEFSPSIRLSSTVPRPVLVDDVQDARPDSLLFSFGIAEKCARHEKILQFLMSGSNSSEKRGLNISLVSDLMGLHTLAFDMCQLSVPPLDDDFCLYEVHSQSSLIYPGSEFYVPKPFMNFIEDLSNRSMATVHPGGKILFTGTGTEVKDLLSFISEFTLTKNPTNWSKQAMLVPHYNRMDCIEANGTVSDSLKWQAVTVAPVRSPEKLKLKPSPRKKISRKAGKERDLYKKNYFHACESLLSLLLDTKRCGRTTVLSLKKSGPELSQLLIQCSVGIAGTGIAVIFSVMCKMTSGKVPFCVTKLLNTGFGFGLVWLSGAVNSLRDTVISLNKKPGKLGLNEDVMMMRRVNRSLNEIFFRAATLMAVAVLRFA